MQYPTSPAIAARFWAKVKKTDSTDDCWLWQAGKDSQGKYGYFHPTRNLKIGAHRYAYFIIVGPIPDGLEPDHLCCVTLCCNPWHVEPKTHRDNVLRSNSVVALHARKTHCRYGHLLAGENLDPYPKWGRVRFCLVCRRRRDYESWLRTRKEKLPITHCPQGHKYDEENTYIDKKGRRACKACRRVSALRWYMERGGKERRQKRNKALALQKQLHIKPAA